MTFDIFEAVNVLAEKFNDASITIGRFDSDHTVISICIHVCGEGLYQERAFRDDMPDRIVKDAINQAIAGLERAGRNRKERYLKERHLKDLVKS